jgi:hypothetical protein
VLDAAPWLEGIELGTALGTWLEGEQLLGTLPVGGLVLGQKLGGVPDGRSLWIVVDGGARAVGESGASVGEELPSGAVLVTSIDEDMEGRLEG